MAAGKHIWLTWKASKGIWEQDRGGERGWENSGINSLSFPWKGGMKERWKRECLPSSLSWCCIFCCCCSAAPPLKPTWDHRHDPEQGHTHTHTCTHTQMRTCRHIQPTRKLYRDCVNIQDILHTCIYTYLSLLEEKIGLELNPNSFLSLSQ